MKSTNDWNRINRSKFGGIETVEYFIEWSPSGWVRARKTKTAAWVYKKCKKAEYAESIGLSLL